jgi:hypothetical protein
MRILPQGLPRLKGADDYADFECPKILRFNGFELRAGGCNSVLKFARISRANCRKVGGGCNLALLTEVSGSSSAVERQLPKLDVAGSIPVSRSINIPRKSQ